MKSTERNLAVRVDASEQIGTGHFMRCLALADGLGERGARVRFIGRFPEELRRAAIGNGHQVSVLPPASGASTVRDLPHASWLGTSQEVDAEETARALSGRRWDWLVVDHYALDARWESALRPCASGILAIDDLADRMHDCDVLLDQNLNRDLQERYVSRVPAHCRLLLGPSYALLRGEFVKLHASPRARDGKVQRILILMGGVDRDNLTALAIDAASRQHGKLAVDVVIGAQNPSRESIAALCRQHGYALFVQPADLARLMADADLAIGVGGVTAWERCCAGLPTLMLCGAENQREQIHQMALRGLAYAPDIPTANAEALAAHLRAVLENPALLAGLSQSGAQAVDGGGVRRVARALGCGTVEVREATIADSARLLAWRNHPSIRAVSASKEPLAAAEHERWFTGVLADSDRHLLLGEQHGEPVGVVRFDVKDGAAEVSIYLAPGREGDGRGGDLLQAAETWLAARRPAVRTLSAQVLRDNHGSHGLFASGGYQRVSTSYGKELAQR